MEESITDIAKSEGLKNFYLGMLTADDLPAAVEELYLDHQVYSTKYNYIVHKITIKKSNWGRGK